VETGCRLVASWSSDLFVGSCRRPWAVAWSDKALSTGGWEENNLERPVSKFSADQMGERQPDHSPWKLHRPTSAFAKLSDFDS
jgi:hypothetical protein